MLTFHAIGDWGPGQVQGRWVKGGGGGRAVAPEGAPDVAPEVERAIEEAWERASGRKGVLLFDGPMCRLERWHADPSSLRLELSPTSYKRFFGTNLSHPELAGRYGRQALANAVGLSAVLATADGHLLLGRRNAAVAYYPERTHPFSGALEPPEAADVFAAVCRELAEELALARADVPGIRCLGIVEDQAILQPELIFRADTTRTRAEVESQLDAGEHRAIAAIPASSGGVDDALRDPNLTPVAVGALLLWGRAAWGDDWFEARRALAEAVAGARAEAGPEAGRDARIRDALARSPRAMTVQLARELGVPEVDVIRTLPQGWARELDVGRWEELLRALEGLGNVHVIVTNGAATLESFGRFGNFSTFGEYFNVQTKGLDMHIRFRQLAAAFAVEKPGHMDGVNTLSFQFYDREGAAAFKVFLSFGGKPAPPERYAAFDAMRERFARAGERSGAE